MFRIKPAGLVATPAQIQEETPMNREKPGVRLDFYRRHQDTQALVPLQAYKHESPPTFANMEVEERLSVSPQPEDHSTGEDCRRAEEFNRMPLWVNTQVVELVSPTFVTIDASMLGAPTALRLGKIVDKSWSPSEISSVAKSENLLSSKLLDFGFDLNKFDRGTSPIRKYDGSQDRVRLETPTTPLDKSVIRTMKVENRLIDYIVMPRSNAALQQVFEWDDFPVDGHAKSLGQCLQYLVVNLGKDGVGRIQFVYKNDRIGVGFKSNEKTAFNFSRVLESIARQGETKFRIVGALRAIDATQDNLRILSSALESHGANNFEKVTALVNDRDLFQ